MESRGDGNRGGPDDQKRAQEKKAELVEEQKRLQQEEETLKQDIEKLQRANQSLQEESDGLRKENEELVKKQKDLQAEKEQLEKDNGRLEEAKEARLRNQKGLLQYFNEGNDLENRCRQLRAENFRLSEEQTVLRNQNESLRMEQTRLRNQNESLGGQEVNEHLRNADAKLNGLILGIDVSMPESRFERMKFLLELSSSIETRLYHEASWVSNRLNYLLVSQSFLLTALAVAATSQVNLEFMELISWTVTALAITHILAVFVSIVSAETTLCSLLPLRGIVDDQIRHYGSLNWPKLGTDKRVPPSQWPLEKLPVRYSLFVKGTTYGMIADVVIPISLLVAWCIIAALLGKEQQIFADTCVVNATCA